MNILEKQFLNRSIKKIVSSNKMPNFSSSVELAGLALVNKDYSNAQLVYGSILNDIQERGREHEFNDLLVYSLHTALAYCCTASKKTEEAMIVLTSLYPSITLPLVPYMRAISNVESQNIQKAVSEISNCEKLMSNGYNFLSNEVLNEHIVPEMDSDVMKVKLEQLRLICMLLRSNDCKEIKDATMTKLLKIDDPEGINLLNYVPRLDLFLDDTDEDEIEQPVKSKKKKGKKGGGNAAAKKNSTNANNVNNVKKVDVVKVTNQKVEQKNGGAQSSFDSKGGKTRNVSLQTDWLKRTCGTQTLSEKDNGPSNRELLNILQEMKNKMNAQSKKDDEVRRLLQDQVSELTEQLGDRQDPLACPEYVFLKEKFSELEDKLSKSQQQVVLLQKVLTEQMQHKSRMQATIYANLEAQCYNKISYLCEIQKYLKPGGGHVMSLEECKQQDLMWKSCLRQLSDSKLRFEDYCRNLSDLIFEERYNQLRPNTWPEMPQTPQVADGVYNSFKKILQTEVNHAAKKPEATVVSSAAAAATATSNASNVTVVDTPSVLCRFDKPVAKSVDDESPPYWDRPPFSSFDGRTTGSPIQRPRRAPAIPTIDPCLPNTSISDSCSSISRTTGERGYETEKEIYEFLRLKFQDVDELEWLTALYQFRDSHGGNLTRLPPDVVVAEIQKMIKLGKKTPAWTTTTSKRPAPVNIPKPKAQENKDNQCIICFDQLKPVTSYILACKHEFHKTCISNWLKRTSACPICRADVEEEDYPELPPPMTKVTTA